MKFVEQYTPDWLNYSIGFLGLFIIWMSTHNFVAVLGGVVAGIHITVSKKQEPPQESKTEKSGEGT